MITIVNPIMINNEMQDIITVDVSIDNFLKITITNDNYPSIYNEENTKIVSKEFILKKCFIKLNQEFYFVTNSICISLPFVIAISFFIPISLFWGKLFLPC